MSAVGEVPESVRVPLGTKLFYGLGAAPFGVLDQGLRALLLLFYSQIVGVNPAAVGTVLMVSTLIDAFIDPVIGEWSDNLRSRMGRRHPFMYASMLPSSLLFGALWFPPAGWSDSGHLAYMATVLITLRVVVSFYEIPSVAQGPEITADYDERTSMISMRYFFLFMTGAVLTVVAYTLLLQPTEQYPVGQLNPEGYRTYSFVAAGVMVAAILISAAGTHSQIARLPRFEGTRTNLRDTFKGILLTLKNRAFLILIGAGVFSYTNQGLNFALSTYFNTYLWEFPAAVIAVFTLAVMAGVGFSLVLANLCSRRWGKRKAAIRFSVCYVFAATAPFMLRYLGWFPANDDPLLLPLLLAMTLVGVALGVGGMILGSSMISDVVEQAQEQSGQRTEGLFFAGSFFMQKCVSGIGLLISGTLLAAVAFPESAVPGEVPQHVLDELVLWYCGLTVALGLIAATILSRFPISEEDHQERLERLAQAASAARTST
ncbi:MAG: MFS transporter [Novosphingobium sp.]|nr:MFS transporter [Novosphingobium sp.]